MIPGNSRQLTAQKLDGSIDIACMEDSEHGEGRESAFIFIFSELIYPHSQSHSMMGGEGVWGQGYSLCVSVLKVSGNWAEPENEARADL